MNMLKNEQNMDTSTRLNKFISQSGICSRREADRFIEGGKVTINGKKAEVGDLVYAGYKVKVNGREIESSEEPLVFFGAQ